MMFFYFYSPNNLIICFFKIRYNGTPIPYTAIDSPKATTPNVAQYAPKFKSGTLMINTIGTRIAFKTTNPRPNVIILNKSFFINFPINKTNAPPNSVAAVPINASYMPNPKNRLNIKHPIEHPRTTSGQKNARTNKPSANLTFTINPEARLPSITHMTK